MTIKEKLIQEVENVSESLLAETLDFVLFLKSRYVEEETTSEEKENILSSQTAYLSGDYTITLSKRLIEKSKQQSIKRLEEFIKNRVSSHEKIIRWELSLVERKHIYQIIEDFQPHLDFPSLKYNLPVA